MTKAIITLTNDKSDFDLEFDLLNHSVTEKWIEHVQLFVEAGQPWDDRERFYNFPSSLLGKAAVVDHLKFLVQTIKNYAPEIVTREVSDELTQDDLNYLHHVFEVYHGLYDQQDTNEFFKHAPKAVQDALGDLNIWIHRYESLNGIPRFVATWKHKPYRDQLEDSEYQLFDLHEQWGDLIVNYCEIGKTLYDLWRDNDQHIADAGFQPLKHVCFDFTVRFSNKSAETVKQTEQAVWNYYDQRQDFFAAHGYTKHDPRLGLGFITIGKIKHHGCQQDLINSIAQHQKFKSIKIE